MRFARDKRCTALYPRGRALPARILFHEDITGREITQTLLAEVLRCENIELRENTVMLDFFADAAACGGVVAMGPDGAVRAIGAGRSCWPAAASAGCTKLDQLPHITGDAIAMALRHGVACRHLDYIQIHPTTLFSRKRAAGFLISESVRGEGALLLDKTETALRMSCSPRCRQRGHPRPDGRTGTEHVWEDMRPIGEAVIREHFPNILERCEEEGLRPPA